MKLKKLLKETTHFLPRTTKGADTDCNGRFDSEKCVIKLCRLYEHVTKAQEVFKAQCDALQAAPSEFWPDDKWLNRVEATQRKFEEVLNPENRWEIVPGEYANDRYGWGRRTIKSAVYGTGPDAWMQQKGLIPIEREAA